MKRKSKKSASRGSKNETISPVASFNDIASPSPAARVPMAFSVLNPKVLKLKTLGDHIYLLPPEIRYMIYDWLVAWGTIDVIQKWFPKPKKSFVAYDVVGYLCKGNGFWQIDISTWLVGRKELVPSKKMGFFDPRNTVFDLSFKKLPCKEKFYGSKRNDKRLWDECLAWDYFAHSGITMSVQHITVHLERSQIFQDKNGSIFELDLRCLSRAHFRDLQSLDFFLDERFVSREIDVPAYQEEREEVPDLLPYFERECAILLHNFWKLCGWHHPCRACSCCQLPEVSFHYRQPGSQEWKPVILPFQKVEMVLGKTDADFVRPDRKRCYRDRLKNSAGWDYLFHH